MPAPHANPPLGFISYSHKDEVWLDRLRPFLKQLRRLGVMEDWSDREIKTGDKWFGEIKARLERAKVAVLLISQDFLASDFCMEDEVPFLLEQAGTKGLLLVPVLLRPCAWKLEPWLNGREAGRQMTPRDGKTVAQHYGTQNEWDAFFTELVEFIAKELTKPPQPIATPAPAPPPTDRYDLTRLPGSGRELFGRKAELAFLDEAWETATTHVVSLVAWGGVGKSALVNRWLEGLANRGWGGAERAYGWSFYSQGSHENAVSSADAFILAALRWFGDPAPEHGTAWDKGEQLAALVRQQQTLLVLDGLEPLQWGSGVRGEIKDPALATLIAELARDNHGLVVITTREPVSDLEPFSDTTKSCNLNWLTPAAGRALLRVRGVSGTDAELEGLSAGFGNHALAVTLLASWLAGETRPHVLALRAIAELPELDPARDRHPRRVIAAFAERFREGPERQVLRLLGLFDRPAEARDLEALLAAPPIPGLTDHLSALDDPLLAPLRTAGLLAPASPHHPGGLDAHPLVREHFADELRQHHPEAWRAGNDRLYLNLIQRPAKDLPDTLEEMQPLLLAIPHGCAAGRHQQTLGNIFLRRIRRGKEHYLTKKIGAFGADLAALACFFEPPWQQPLTTLSAANQAFLFNEAAYDLHALNRLAEAVEPMRAALTAWIEQAAWESAAISATNLGGLLVTLGRLDAAETMAVEAVSHAERADDAIQRITSLAVLAEVRHQRDASAAAAAATGFAEAEAQQQQLQPALPRLYSVRGAQYCDLLLGQGRFAEVRQRATQTLDWAIKSLGLLDIALDHLSLGRAWAGAGDHAAAAYHLDAAVAGLRQAGQQDYLPRGLLARAGFRRQRGDFGKARRDLDEARRIAGRGGMKLYLIDYDLESARLALAENPKADIRELLNQAHAAIAETGYHRRDPEVTELERALA